MTDWRVILMQGGELVSYSNDMLARHFVVVIYLYIKLFSILPKNMISHNIKKMFFMSSRDSFTRYFNMTFANVE